MPSDMHKNRLSSRVLKTEYVKWKNFNFIQDDTFKELSTDAFTRLKSSIVANNFTQPFYVWEDSDHVIYCLDGKHRTLALNALENEGYSIPNELPATFIACNDKQEAAKLVIIYSSIYAKITQQGLFDFINDFDLNLLELKQEMDLPDFSIDRFEQKFDVFDIKSTDYDNDFEYISEKENILVSKGDLFQLGKHRLVCGTFTEKNTIDELMNGNKARILMTDPPYNLPTNFFSNTTEKNRHKDFAMASGEMSDNEFVTFLASIMDTAKRNTLDGSIHYIFMDWRHVWHMTEAGKQIYGSAMPKQVCVWNKDMMANGSFYRAQHELCFVFADTNSKYLWNNDIVDKGGFYKNNNDLIFIFKNGEAKHLSHLELKDRIRTNVWNYPSATSLANPDRMELKNHPTPKPVAMIADAILDTTLEEDIVIDLFLGSGTTLIACEKTNRVCYATEIEPNYVQSIIKRYIKFCRRNDVIPTLVHLNGNLTLNQFEDGPNKFENGRKN